MNKVKIYKNGILAGYLEEFEAGKYRLIYDDIYKGESISLSMPLKNKIREFNRFPEFFENLLPEELMLEGMCKLKDIGKHDYITQLSAAGKNLPGDIEAKEDK